MRKLLSGLVLVLSMAGCGQKTEPAAPIYDAKTTAPETVAKPKTGDIEWFDGGIDAAFAAAANQHQHVFLYWGANWCPPCHELKAFVFTRPDFRDKLKQFIPVYLDGDAPGAQKLAEAFGVVGYPAVVILRADRTEVARIAGGMDLSRYVDVLDLALDDGLPLNEMLADLQSNSRRTLTGDECKRVAFNGWILDTRADAAPGSLATALSRAAARCPATAQVERDRLIISAAGLAAHAEHDQVMKGKPGSEFLRSLLAQVSVLLADSKRSLKNADVLLFLGDDYFAVAAQLQAKRREALLDSWLGTLDSLVSDQRYDDSLRLDAVGVKLQAAQLLGKSKKLSPQLTADARRTLDEFLSRRYDEHAHVSIVNSALGVTHYLGDTERTRAILEAEIKASKTPFYYMVDLADLEEQAGRKAEALALLQRAYETSTGTATRFQWGTLYVNGLLRMTPDDQPRIQAATVQVLGELDGPDRIYQRTRLRLEKLGRELREWGKKPKRGDTLLAISDRWQQVCAHVPVADPLSQSCKRMLGTI